MNLHKLGCPLIDEYNPNNLECTCSQLSSVPVINDISDVSDEEIIQHYSPSTPEVSWESSFRELFSTDIGNLFIIKEIVDFIKNIEQKAYERGQSDKVTESTKFMKELVDTAKSEERKRVNDILDEVKNSLAKELEKWDESAEELEDGWGNYTVCLPWQLKEKKVDISTIIDNLKQK